MLPEGRHIPGFYFDADKKKYFKIQQNHQVLPPKAKHSVDSVNRERREVKRRKIEDRKQDLLTKQTVRRPAVLRNELLAGITLDRELGLPGRCKEARDAVLARELIQNPTLTQVIPPGRTIFDFHHTLGGLLVASGGEVSSLDFIDAYRRNGLEGHRACYAGFNSRVTSLSLCADRFVATTLEPRHLGNVFLGKSVIDNNPRHPSGNSTYGVECIMKLGGNETALWCSSAPPERAQVAVGASDGVYFLDVAECQQIAKLATELGVYALDWLTPNVVALSGKRPHGGSEGVNLWDVRTRDSSFRFRTKNCVTGVRAANDSEQQLLVTGHHDIMLFDVRMPPSRPRRSVLQISHQHFGLRATFDTDGKHLIAAVGAENQVCVYSTRTGKRLSVLGGYQHYDEQIMKLRWCEDDIGRPMIQGCQKGVLIEWSWNGRDDVS